MNDQNFFEFSEFGNAEKSKPRETSLEALEGMNKNRGEILRMVVLAQFEDGDFTADEVAGLIEEHPLSVRPRVSELAKRGLIYDTGLRRRSQMGRPSIVWGRAVPNEH